MMVSGNRSESQPTSSSTTFSSFFFDSRTMAFVSACQTSHCDASIDVHLRMPIRSSEPSWRGQATARGIMKVKMGID